MAGVPTGAATAVVTQQPRLRATHRFYVVATADTDAEFVPEDDDVSPAPLAHAPLAHAPLARAAAEGVLDALLPHGFGAMLAAAGVTRAAWAAAWTDAAAKQFVRRRGFDTDDGTAAHGTGTFKWQVRRLRLQPARRAAGAADGLPRLTHGQARLRLQELWRALAAVPRPLRELLFPATRAVAWPGDMADAMPAFSDGDDSYGSLMARVDGFTRLPPAFFTADALHDARWRLADGGSIAGAAEHTAYFVFKMTADAAPAFALPPAAPAVEAADVADVLALHELLPTTALEGGAPRRTKPAKAKPAKPAEAAEAAEPWFARLSTGAGAARPAPVPAPPAPVPAPVPAPEPTPVPAPPAPPASAHPPGARAAALLENIMAQLDDDEDDELQHDVASAADAAAAALAFRRAAAGVPDGVDATLVPTETRGTRDGRGKWRQVAGWWQLFVDGATAHVHAQHAQRVVQGLRVSATASYAALVGAHPSAAVPWRFLRGIAGWLWQSEHVVLPLSAWHHTARDLSQLAAPRDLAATHTLALVDYTHRPRVVGLVEATHTAAPRLQPRPAPAGAGDGVSALPYLQPPRDVGTANLHLRIVGPRTNVLAFAVVFALAQHSRHALHGVTVAVAAADDDDAAWLAETFGFARTFRMPAAMTAAAAVPFRAAAPPPFRVVPDGEDKAQWYMYRAFPLPGTLVRILEIVMATMEPRVEGGGTDDDDGSSVDVSVASESPRPGVSPTVVLAAAPRRRRPAAPPTAAAPTSDDALSTLSQLEAAAAAPRAMLRSLAVRGGAKPLLIELPFEDDTSTDDTSTDDTASTASEHDDDTDDESDTASTASEHNDDTDDKSNTESGDDESDTESGNDESDTPSIHWQSSDDDDASSSSSSSGSSSVGPGTCSTCSCSTCSSSARTCSTCAAAATAAAAAAAGGRVTHTGSLLPPLREASSTESDTESDSS